MLTRSIPTAEITISLPIAAFVPTWNWDNWELKRREGKMQSQATHFHGQWISNFWGEWSPNV